MSEWKLYKRVGEIEARPWTDADVQMARGYGTVGDGCLVSVSDADLHAAKATPPIGYVARNPANHADQWYIAPAYFAKHYASTPPIVGEDAGDVKDAARYRHMLHEMDDSTVLHMFARGRDHWSETIDAAIAAQSRQEAGD